MSTVKIAGLNLQLQAVVDGDDMVVPLQPINVPVQPGQVAGVLAALGLDMKDVAADLARSYDEQVAQAKARDAEVSRLRGRDAALEMLAAEQAEKVSTLRAKAAYNDGVVEGLNGAPNRATRRAAAKK